MVITIVEGIASIVNTWKIRVNNFIVMSLREDIKVGQM